jgi:hypothetical protein
MSESIAIRTAGVVSGNETVGVTEVVGATILGIDSITTLTIWAIKTGSLIGVGATAGAILYSFSSTL